MAAIDRVSVDDASGGMPQDLTQQQTRLAGILTPPVPAPSPSPTNPLVDLSRQLPDLLARPTPPPDVPSPSLPDFLTNAFSGLQQFGRDVGRGIIDNPLLNVALTGGPGFRKLTQQATNPPPNAEVMPGTRALVEAVTPTDLSPTERAARVDSATRGINVLVGLAQPQSGVAVKPLVSAADAADSIAQRIVSGLTGRAEQNAVAVGVRSDATVPEGFTRLYRGEKTAHDAVTSGPEMSSRGGWFTNDPEYASKYGGPSGRIYAVDVPTSELPQYATGAGERVYPAGTNPADIMAGVAQPEKIVREYILPRDLAAQRVAAVGTQAPSKEEVFREIGANLDNLNVPAETKALILQNADANFDPVLQMSFADQRRGVVAISDMLQKAADMVPGLDMTKLASQAPGKAANAETILATGMALAKQGETVTGLAGKIASGAATDADRAQMVLEMAQMNTLQRVFAGQRAEAGRSLRALQEAITAGASPRDMYQAAASAIGGKQNATKLMDALDALWNRVGPNGLPIDAAQRDADIFKFVSQLDSPGKFDWVQEAWRNSILSSPITHEINTIGNALVLATERTATRTAAATIEAARAGFGLRNVQRQVYFSEIVPGVLGAFKGIPDGFSEGLHILANGSSPTDVQKFVESNGRMFRQQAIPGGLGAVINAPTRALAAEDAVFTQMAYKAELNSQAARIAAKEGLSGADFTQRVAGLLADPTIPMMSAARDSADLITLKREPSRIAQQLLGLRRNVPGFGFVVPFITTPDNLLRLGAQYSPIGLGSALRPSLTAEQRALIAGRAAVGSALMGFFGTQLVQGNVTAGYPTDPQERKQFIAEGKQPYSINIGGNWVQFRRFEPLSTPLVWTAAMYDAWKRGEGDWSKALPNMGIAVGRAILDIAYLSGVTGLVNALNNPEQAVPGFVSSIISGAIPFSGFLRGLEQTGDPYLRDPQDLLQRIEASLPGLSGNVKPQLLVTGEPAMRPPSKQGIGALINPILISPEVQNATMNELNKLKTPDTIGPDGKTIPGQALGLEFPSEQIRGLKLTGDEAFQLNQTAQRLSLAKLKDLFASQEYQGSQDWRKRELAQREIDRARHDARAQVADQIVSEATTPDQIARGAVMKIGTLDPTDSRSKYGVRAQYIQDLQKKGKLSSTVRSAIDATRGQTIDGKPEPTVSEYLAAEPLVRQYLASPPYGSTSRPYGNSQEWALVAATKKKMADYIKSNPKPPGVADWMWYARVDREGASLVRRYDIVGPNQDRVRLLKAHPELDRYLAAAKAFE